jgi:hypothetical protein
MNWDLARITNCKIPSVVRLDKGQPDNINTKLWKVFFLSSGVWCQKNMLAKRYPITLCIPKKIIQATIRIIRRKDLYREEGAGALKSLYSGSKNRNINS